VNKTVAGEVRQEQQLIETSLNLQLCE